MLAVFAVTFVTQRLHFFRLIVHPPFPFRFEIQRRDIVKQHLHRLSQQSLRLLPGFALNPLYRLLIQQIHGLIHPIQVQRNAAVCCQVHHRATLRTRLRDARQHQFFQNPIARHPPRPQQPLKTILLINLAKRFAHADRDP